jgi:acyl-coenzyme A thioesterase PaaI-like protein
MNMDASHTAVQHPSIAPSSRCPPEGPHVTGRLPLTQEYKINLLASASEEDLIATSEVIKAGKRSAVVETRIHSASDTLVAIGLTSLQIRS